MNYDFKEAPTPFLRSMGEILSLVESGLDDQAKSGLDELLASYPDTDTTPVLAYEFGNYFAGTSTKDDIRNRYMEEVYLINEKAGK